MPQQEPRRVAVIDLGSNTARLIVMQATPGYAYRLADEIREVVRLREGMVDGALSEDAIERALFTLRLFERFCDTTGVDIIIPTATSAVREATNGQQFVQRVQREIGLTLQVLDGEREAYYGTVGALNEISMERGHVVDIGGGSAQITEVRKGQYHRGGSVPLGALALTERFVRSDPIKRADFEAVRDEIGRQLDTLRWLKPRKGRQLIGLGGTIRNLARIEARRQNYPLQTQHGFELSRDAIEESIAQFRELPLSKRAKILGINSDRADIILPGAMALQGIMDRLDAETLIVSVNGLREGVFFEQFFWEGHPSPIVSDIRSFGVLNLARVYGYHKQHANHVRHLAGRLFTQLAPLHGYAIVERELLEAAALLHDLGTLVSYEHHHKHSQMLIVNNGLPGYTPREIALIALLARYHRRGNPTTDIFAAILDGDDEKLLIRLAALLRLAEYLERGRNGAVEDVTASWDDAVLRLSLIADAFPAVELWDAERNAVPLVERAFQRQVHVESISAPDDWVKTQEADQATR